MDCQRGCWKKCGVRRVLKGSLKNISEHLGATQEWLSRGLNHGLRCYGTCSRIYAVANPNFSRWTLQGSKTSIRVRVLQLSPFAPRNLTTPSPTRAPSAGSQPAVAHTALHRPSTRRVPGRRGAQIPSRPRSQRPPTPPLSNPRRISSHEYKSHEYRCPAMGLLAARR